MRRQTIFPWFPSVVLVLLAACAPSEPPQSKISPSAPVLEPAQPASPQPSPPPIVKRPTLSPSVKQSPENRVASSPSPNAAPSNPTAPRQPTFRTAERMAGFSADGRHFIYLESSRDTGAGIPKSSLQVVDVSSGACATNGCLETRYREADAERTIADAEADLLKQSWKVRQDLKLTPPVTGTELPLTARSRTPDGTETVSVRLNDGKLLQLRLLQKRQTADDRAAMQLAVTYDGQQQSIDSLDNFRNVVDYSIRSVRLSPNGSRIAVLITAAKPTFEGTLGTTIVQGFELQ
ncbi:DUF2259 domain-containing protein [Leptolyngbya sp. FACHB-36]|uniref:DUF2259 domain-containing protein n=1 Tax=Leptolyngbya sp. FACHB-36 TaxID=2692808 RepID=UPI00167FF4C9|nr:DUF2259 domain-containing protein [Leptolyngbya sp. FACHB-36]MBD2020393.1 DUF2259 domain-containing protein [Leptolyngbya sp. FACHB-36]